MKYALIKNGTALQYKDFATETPPVLAANKGVWLPVVEGEYPTLTDNQTTTEVCYEDDNQWLITWVIRTKTDLEKWHNHEFVKRIVAPVSLIFDASGIGLSMKAWFDLENLPIVKEGDMVYLYCNEIRPEHQSIVDSLQGVISVENIPVE